MNEFKTLNEGYMQFKRHAISGIVPPKIERAIQGGYYAGAQCALTLLAEAMKITPAIAPKELLEIVSECQAFFVSARAQAESRIQEKGKTKHHESCDCPRCKAEKAT